MVADRDTYLLLIFTSVAFWGIYTDDLERPWNLKKRVLWFLMRYTLCLKKTSLTFSTVT